MSHGYIQVRDINSLQIQPLTISGNEAQRSSFTLKPGLVFPRFRSLNMASGARFSKAPETSRAREAIFNLFVSKNREVCAPGTFCMKRTSVQVKNMRLKQLRNDKVRDFWDLRETGPSSE